MYEPGIPVWRNALFTNDIKCRVAHLKKLFYCIKWAALKKRACILFNPKINAPEENANPFNGYHAILIKVSGKNDQQLLTVKPILLVLKGERFFKNLI